MSTNTRGFGSSKGSDHPSARLRPEQVLAIRRSRLSCGRLAKKYGISRQAVFKIKNRDSWKWLTDGGTKRTVAYNG